ncbi:MAG: leucine-rich repeat domain-containing protein [Dehalococcoidia bacterium]
MNNLNIFILVFLSFALISCGSSSSEEIESKNNPSDITNITSKKQLDSSLESKKNDFERKVIPTLVRNSSDNKKNSIIYPTIIPTLSPTPSSTYNPNVVVFENVEFENYMKEKLGKSLIDSYITFEDISKIKEIEIRGQIGTNNLNNRISMEHIRDLRYFTNIEKLTIREAGINDIQGIEDLINLEYLDLSYNEIENIENISFLPNLVHLYLYDNEISDIWAFTPQKNPYLEHLWLDGNNISSIAPFVPSMNEFAKQLTHVGLGRNPIVSENWDKAFSENSFTLQIPDLGIDDEILNELLSQEHGFPNLKYINLGGNKKIKDLEPLLELKALKQITLDEKLNGTGLDRLMRDDGIDKLSEIGVDVTFVNY